MKKITSLLISAGILAFSLTTSALADFYICNEGSDSCDHVSKIPSAGDTVYKCENASLGSKDVKKTKIEEACDPTISYKSQSSDSKSSESSESSDSKSSESKSSDGESSESSESSESKSSESKSSESSK